ncbi:MAG: DUF2062 domain-containing protein [Candidatus Accumulibacter necessarius]|jgi:uncharacterized protein (DUF2062 family)|uniref:DUF2062 domain-containing protein n=1 Tax=Candidatus Accumulibacter necessarius TaxID=2954386 RepID=UPI002FC35181
MILDRLTHLVPTREQLAANRCLRWLGPLLLDPRLWRWSRRGVARGVSIGVFFGLLVPVAQIPLSVVTAVALRACIPAAATSTLVTNPLTFPPVYFAAYKLGLWVTGDAAGVVPQQPTIQDGDERSLWQKIAGIGRPLLVGLTITATIAGLASYVTINLGWYGWLAIRRRRRRVPHA